MTLIKHPSEDLWANLDQVKFLSLNGKSVDLHFDLSGYGVTFKFENEESAKEFINHLIKTSEKIKKILNLEELK